MAKTIQQLSLLTLAEGKICKQCGQLKAADRFSRILPSCNLRSVCKDCRRPSREVQRERGQVKWTKHRQRILLERKIRRATLSQDERAVERERRRRYVARHKEEVRAYQLKWHSENEYRVKEWGKSYRARNATAIRARNIRRRSIQANVGGHYSAREWRELCNKFDNRCLSCGKAKKLTVDHVIPVALGGDSFITNLQPLCLQCNLKKGVQVIDFRLKSTVG